MLDVRSSCGLRGQWCCLVRQGEVGLRSRHAPGKAQTCSHGELRLDPGLSVVPSYGRCRFSAILSETMSESSPCDKKLRHVAVCRVTLPAAGHSTDDGEHRSLGAGRRAPKDHRICCFFTNVGLMPGLTVASAEIGSPHQRGRCTNYVPRGGVAMPVPQ